MKNVLSFLLYMVHYPQSALRFVFHQVLLPYSSNADSQIELEKRVKRILEYRDTLLQVYENRLKEAILPEDGGHPFTNILRCWVKKET